MEPVDHRRSGLAHNLQEILNLLALINKYDTRKALPTIVTKVLMKRASYDLSMRNCWPLYGPSCKTCDRFVTIVQSYKSYSGCAMVVQCLVMDL